MVGSRFVAQESRQYALTRPQFESLRAILTSKGITPPSGDSGSFDASGFTVTWHYDGASLGVTLSGAWLFIGTAWRTVEGGISMAKATS